MNIVNIVANNKLIKIVFLYLNLIFSFRF